MGAQVSRRSLLKGASSLAALTIIAPATIVTVGSGVHGDKLTSFDPSEPKTGVRIGFLFSGHRNRHDAAVEMYDKGEIDVLVVLGIKDKATFLKRVRTRIQIKETKIAQAKGISPAVGTSMVIRDDSKMYFLKSSDASVDTSTDASGACIWLSKNPDIWLTGKNPVTAIFISDTLHMTRCIKNLINALPIIPENLQSKLLLKQLAVIRPNITISQRISEWGKLGLQRTTGIDRRPVWLREITKIASKPTHG